ITAICFYCTSTSYAPDSPHIFFGTQSGEAGVLKLENGKIVRVNELAAIKGEGPVKSIYIDNLDNLSVVLFIVREFEKCSILSVHRINLSNPVVSIPHCQFSFSGEDAELAIKQGIARSIFTCLNVARSGISVIAQKDVTKITPYASAVAFAGYSGDCLVLDDHKIVLLPINRPISYLPIVHENDGYNKIIRLALAKVERGQLKKSDYISERRSTCQELMFDILAAHVTIDGSLLYPPKNIDEMQKLFEIILNTENKSADDKIAILYYLLRDLDDDSSVEFANENAISCSFISVLDGFWAFDHGDFETAVFKLTSPCAENPYNNNRKILTTLIAMKQASLATIFMKSCKLPVADLIEAQMNLKVSTNIFDALDYQRKLEKNDQTRMFQLLLECAFKSNDSSRQLIFLPFTRFEEDLLVAYCHAQNSKICQEFLLIYYVKFGRYAEALTYYKKIRDPTNLDFIRESFLENLQIVLPYSQSLLVDNDIQIASVDIVITEKPSASVPVANILNQYKVKSEKIESARLGTPNMKNGIVRVSSPFMRRPLTPTVSDVKSVEEIRALHSRERSISVAKTPVASAAENNSWTSMNVEKSKAMEFSAVTVAKSPVGTPTHFDLLMVNLSPFSKGSSQQAHKKLISVERTNPFDDEMNIVENEDKKQFRKTPARMLRNSVAALAQQQLPSELVEQHYSLRSRRTTDKIVFTGADSRNSHARAEIDAKVLKPKTPRAKKVAVPATPTRRATKGGGDDPMTLDELALTPATAKRGGRIPKSTIKQLVAEIPGSARMTTRRMAKLNAEI
ncbi:hypothetical protein HK100_004612, partial [Physocladia obscura]